jgi:RimJ/RimL family protein N-acetyltransferase
MATTSKRFAVSRVSVHAWTEDLGGRAYLESHYATSMFLLGNLSDRGASLTEHPNSGNFKTLSREEKTIGVFCLTRRGNLLLTVEPGPGVNEAIWRACAAEKIELKGVLGELESAASFRDFARARGAMVECSFSSEEILYQLKSIPVFPRDLRVRLLRPEDFLQWLPIRRAYQLEEGVKLDLSEQQLKEIFLRYSGMNEYWGLFLEGRLVATAALNARALDIGQVGGVYTVPDLRGQGLSKAVMRALLRDSAELHGISRMILFTGEKNIPAQRVYEGLGFERIGKFGIFLS